jgi:hypothetical protein
MQMRQKKQDKSARWKPRALSLVRACFRRPLELWLVLDRAMRLLEAERTVQVGLFCPSEITPRNIMIASGRS